MLRNRLTAILLAIVFAVCGDYSPARTEESCVGVGATGHQYNCVAMLDYYIQSDRHEGVAYLNEREREKYELYVLRGKVVSCDGTLFDTSDARTAHSADTRAIYVMGGRGKIYASKEHEVGKFHHSSFLSGFPVAAAGGIKLEKGKIRLVSNRSGHYRPPANTADQVLDELRRRGVKIDSVKKDYHPKSFVDPKIVDCNTPLP